MIIYAVLGTSWALSVSTTTTLAIPVAEGEKRHRESGVWLWLVGLNPEVLAMVQRSPLGETLGRERMHFTLEVGLDKYLASLGAKRTL